MEIIWYWLPVGLLILIGAVLVWRDPRRMPPAIVLALLVFTLAGRAFVALMELAGRLDDEMGEVWLLLGVLGASVLAVLVLGVFLIWNMVEMTRKEGRRPAALVTGAVGMGLIGYVALVFVALLVDSADMMVWLMLIGLPIGYVGFVFTAFLLYALIYGKLTRRFGKPVNAVVILGSGLIAGHRVPPLLAARIDLGLSIYDRSRAAGRPTLIVPSGGRGDDEQLSEAEAMGRYLEDKGVDPRHIVLEDRSTDTRENLVFSAAKLAEHGVEGDVAVATNNFHAFRAATLMRDAKLPGYSVGSPTADYYWPSATAREFLAILRDNLVLNLVLVGLLCIPLLWFAGSMLVGLFR